MTIVKESAASARRTDDSSGDRRSVSRYVAGVTTFTGAPGDGEAWPAQPRALIVTIYGLYAREAGGWLSVASLIRLMAGLGVDEPAVRSSISRLKQRGVLEPRRRDGAAGYALSARGRDILAEGDRRIFDRPRASAGRRLAAGRVQRARAGAAPAARAALPAGLARLRHGVGRRLDRAGPPRRRDRRGARARPACPAYVDLFRADYLAFGDAAGAGRRAGGTWTGCRTSTRSSSTAAGPVLAALGRRRAAPARPTARRSPTTSGR